MHLLLTLGDQSTSSSQAKGRGGGGGGYLGSSMLARTMMIVGLLSIAAQVAYSICNEDISVKVIILIPPEAKIGTS